MEMRFVFFANVGFEKIGFRAAVDDPSKSLLRWPYTLQ
jgi:hypothetical protein